MHDSDIKTTSACAATADHITSPWWNDAVSQPKPFFILLRITKKDVTFY